MSKKQTKYKEKDDVEEYFKEVKNKNFPTGIIFIILFILIIGIALYYYFVIDNPKNIFLTAIDTTFNSINYQEHEKINYEFSLDTSIETTNKENTDIISIIEGFAFAGVGGVDLDNKLNYSKLNTFYKGEELLSVDTYSKNDNVIYFKSLDLYDKVIKFKFKEQAETKQDSVEQIDNLTKLIDSFKKVLKSNLEKASYQKSYPELDNKKVKKVTLLIDKKFLENVYYDLIDNDNFLESYSKLTDSDMKEVIKDFRNEAKKLNNESIKISLYLSILENKFLMLETIDKEERMTLTKENNKYNYKIYNESIIEYQGDIEVIKANNDYEISISHDDIQEELSVTLNLDLSLGYEKDIESFNTDKAVDYEKLTENDMNKMLNRIYQKKAFITLYEDISELVQATNTGNENQINQTV